MINQKTIKACIENGYRLLEDAEYLSRLGSPSSVYMLSKLSQEEIAKAFILILIKEKALDWTKEVERSLNHHVSKQLIGIIIDYLNPETDEFIKMMENGTLFTNPRKVIDAMNIYVNEILLRWKSKNWWWSEDPEYNEEAKSTYNGKDDRLKQDSIYIKISSDGEMTSSPNKITEEMAQKEIEKANRFYFFVNRMKGDELQYKKIVEIFKDLKLNLKD
jgi:AbiV family abortive infection protein